MKLWAIVQGMDVSDQEIETPPLTRFPKYAVVEINNTCNINYGRRVRRHCWVGVRWEVGKGQDGFSGCRSEERGF